MRFFAVKVFPHNVQAENRALLKRIEIYRSLQMFCPGETSEFSNQGNSYDLNTLY